MMLDAAPALLDGGDAAILEIGQTPVSHEAVDVSLQRSYANPVIIPMRSRAGDTQPAAVRITNVTAEAFTVQLVEPTYADGIHVAETLTYLVVEAGLWKLDDGTLLEAGTADLSATANDRTAPYQQPVVFGAAFAKPPTILAQLQTTNDATADHQFAYTRIFGRSETQLHVGIEHAEAIRTTHATETVGYLAIESGGGTWDGKSYYATNTRRKVNEDWTRVPFVGQDFDTVPMVWAGMSTRFGADSCITALDTPTTKAVRARLVEDKSRDTERHHVNEKVSLLVIEGPGLLSVHARGATATRTVFISDRYQVNLVNEATSDGLTSFTVQIRNISGDADYDASGFDGVFFDYTGITGKLHQQTAPPLSITETPTTDQVALATNIDTHFLFTLAEMTVGSDPTEDTNVWASAVDPDAAPPADEFAETSFGTQLTGMFAVDPEELWNFAHIVAETGSTMTFNFSTAGVVGSAVPIGATFVV